MKNIINTENKNILITSDHHIDDYQTRSPTKEFRIKQAKVLSELIINACKNYNCDVHIMAGDLVEKMDRSSGVHFGVKSFLNDLDMGIKHNLIILGNHDTEIKSEGAESRENDLLSSYIGLYFPDNLIYADRRVYEINGKTFGFRNSSRSDTLDLGFIKEQGYNNIDVLVGHSSQIYSESGEAPYVDQKYDESLVNIVSFFGHIHQSVWKNKKVSIGVCQRNKLSDDEPKAVVFNTETGDWKYIDIDPDGKLMKLKETFEVEQNYYDESTNTYYISKKDPNSNKALVQSINKTNYHGIFETEIKKLGLMDVYTAVKNNTDPDKLEKLDLNFKITSIDISNWKSIETFKFKFKNNPDDNKFVITGGNGDGKSSLLEAIVYSITGELAAGTEKDYIKSGKDSFTLNVEFLYKNKLYNIIRTVHKKKSQTIDVIEDGEKLELGGIIDTKNKIKILFPFIEAIWLFYFNKSNSNVLGGNSKEDTKNISLLYKILGFSDIDVYNEVAVGMSKTIKTNLESVYSDVNVKLGIKSSTEDSLRRIFSTPINVKETIDFNTDVDPIINRLKSKKSEEDLLIQKFHAYSNFLKEQSNNKNNIEGYKALIEDCKKTLSEFNEESSLIDKKSNLYVELRQAEKRRDEIKENNNIFHDTRRDLDIKKNNLMKLEMELNVLKTELNSITNRCPIKEGIMCSHISIDEFRSNKQKIINERTEVYNNFKISYEELLSEFNKMSVIEIEDQNNLISDIKLSLSSVESELNNISATRNKLSNLEKLLNDELSKTIINIEPISLEENFFNRHEKLIETIKTLENLKNERDKYYIAKTNYEEAYENYNKLNCSFEKIKQFIELTSPGGDVYKKIFEILMNSFSDEKVKYSINRKKNLISINSYLKKSDGSEVAYSNASTGEKTMIDIHFLKHLGVKFGLLIFDEFLANLDVINHNAQIEILKSLDTNLLFITSHIDSITSINKIVTSKVNDTTTYNLYG